MAGKAVPDRDPIALPALADPVKGGGDDGLGGAVRVADGDRPEGAVGPVADHRGVGRLPAEDDPAQRTEAVDVVLRQLLAEEGLEVGRGAGDVRDPVGADAFEELAAGPQRRAAQEHRRAACQRSPHLLDGRVEAG